MGAERAARESGNFSYRNAWLAEVEGAVAACLLGYPAEEEPGPIAPETPAIFVPLLQLEALAPGSWYLNVLATYAPFRGKGLGRALLAHAETVARQGGHGAVSLIAADTPMLEPSAASYEFGTVVIATRTAPATFVFTNRRALPTPPLAMTGTGTASAMARVSSRS